MPVHRKSPEERTNRSHGRWLGFGVAFLLALWGNSDGHLRGTWILLLVGWAAFVAACTLIGGAAAVATGRLPSGGGVSYGMVSAMLALAMFAVLASFSDVARGRKELSQLPITAFAVLFFGAVPALVVGALAGLALSRMVKRPPVRPPP